ncbi:MAG: hypothetical protein KDA90_12850, partial [Planctomycetaceae bacterium]|nr:hypothetical protein [Planctomycetaceae bacterium]
FTEPAGAVALAGALQAARKGEISAEATCICIVSGSGFKDAKAIQRMNQDVDCPLLDAEAINAW